VLYLLPSGPAMLFLCSLFRLFLSFQMPRGILFAETLHQTAIGLDDINWYVASVGMITLLTGIFVRRRFRKLPYMIVAMIAGSAYAAALNLIPQLHVDGQIEMVRALSGIFPQFSVRADHEAMRLVAQPLDEIKHRIARFELDGFAVRHEQGFPASIAVRAFCHGHQADLGKSEALENLPDGVELAATAVDDDEVGPLRKRIVVRFGFSGLKGVGEKAIECIIEERTKHGHYTSIFDLAKRVNQRAANKKSLESLIYSGAFDCFKDITSCYRWIWRILILKQNSV